MCYMQVSAAAKAAAVQEQLKENTLEEGLENHSTQGSHGVNYHHPEQGDTGYQFFMPSCACSPYGQSERKQATCSTSTTNICSLQ